MARTLIKTKKIILLLGDIAIFYLALYLTLLLRYGYPVEAANWDKHLIAFSFIFIVWLIILFISDFYDLKASYNNLSLLSTSGKAIVACGVMAVMLFYFLSPLFPNLKPQRILLIELILVFILLFLWRKIFYGLIKSSKITNRVLFIGNSPLIDELIGEIKKRPQLGYQALTLSVLPENLHGYCLENQIDILINADSLTRNNPEAAKKILGCLSLGIDVYNLNAFYEQITNKVPIEFIEHSWFLENLTENSKKPYEIFKRLLDIIMAIICLIITLPFTPIIALFIKLESPGPVIFKQIRTGKNGKEFLAMKFRSMVKDAEKNGAQWATKNDVRVTRFGSLMRKTRIDEIPQLLNILRGEMSFIGPRPERPEFVKILTEAIPFYQERLLVKPGLTGWAQLLGPAYGGSQEESLEKLKYDLYYIEHRSLVLDISIILKTIRVVLSGRGQ